MAKFVIAPHFRLHEWVAEEKGYFAAAGLDYEFRESCARRRDGGTISAIGSAPTRRSRRAARPTSAAPATGR